MTDSAAATKKRFGAGKIVGIALLVMIVGVGAATAAGVMPGLSALAGTAKQKDLGVDASQAAFESAMGKAGVDANYPATPAAIGSVTVKGSKPLDATFTDDEVSALMNAYLVPFEYNVRGVQVVFHDGGNAEGSAMVTYQGVDMPGYIKGTVSWDGRVSGTASAASAAGIPANGSWLETGQNKTLQFVNLYFAVPGLTIESAEMREGEVHVTGTVPESITTR